MGTFQFYRNFWTFKSEKEVIEPFIYVRTLSNGVVIAKATDDQEYGISLKEIKAYIKKNHIEKLN
jgi:hypothetical protein